MKITHPNDLIFVQDNISKKDIVHYYEKIAPFMLPYLVKRPIVMERFPDTITQEGFYHKQVPDFFPDYIKRVRVQLKKGGQQDLATIDEAKDLAFLANQRVLTFHSWLSQTKHLNKPDKIVFDLDPAKKSRQDLNKATLLIKNHFDSQDLTSYVMTTGAHGYHVVLYIRATHGFSVIHDWAKKQAQRLESTYPTIFTTNVKIEDRKGKIFIDYLRNTYGQTSVVPYSIRALPGAPVATPLSWGELKKKTTHPQRFTIKNIMKRLAHKNDPWQKTGAIMNDLSRTLIT